MTAYERRVDVVLRDAETGERVVRGWYYPDSDRSMKDYKRWLLRWRSGYKRRTGHRLVVEVVSTETVPARDGGRAQLLTHGTVVNVLRMNGDLQYVWNGYQFYRGRKSGSLLAVRQPNSKEQ